MTLRNWAIGYYIVEYEQDGSDRAEYGSHLLKNLEKQIDQKGMNYTLFKACRQFYKVYPQIGSTVSSEFKLPDFGKSSTVSNEFVTDPDVLVNNLSFSHIREIMVLNDAFERFFYETECMKCNWNVRKLRRQIKTNLYVRAGIIKSHNDSGTGGALVYDLQLSSKGHFVHYRSDFHTSDEYGGVRYLHGLSVLAADPDDSDIAVPIQWCLRQCDGKVREAAGCLYLFDAGTDACDYRCGFRIVLFYIGFLGEGFESAEIDDFTDVSGSAAESGAFLLVGAAAVANVVLNFIFIRIFGYVAAGYTTLACYILYSVGHYVVSKRILVAEGIEENLMDAGFLLASSAFLIGVSVICNLLFPYRILRYAILFASAGLVFWKRELLMNTMADIRKK